jgi:predicted DNA-binding antitoxin AbrB/MazE fold protein
MKQVYCRPRLMSYHKRSMLAVYHRIKASTTMDGTSVMVRGLQKGAQMATTVEAIYEQGVLRLIQPLSLAEGTRVAVIVFTREPTAEGGTPADILAAIAALPMEADGEEFSGRDHDKILYGDKGAQ